MPTFADLYCSRNNCPPPAFRRMIFWRTLPWYVLPFAPLWLLAGCFKPDRGLIDACAAATCMEDIQEEIQIQPAPNQPGRGLPPHAKLRISTQRLRQLAACYLMKAKPDAGRASPPAAGRAVLAG